VQWPLILELKEQTHASKQKGRSNLSIRQQMNKEVICIEKRKVFSIPA